MGDPRWPVLHAAGWVLLVTGGTLWALLQAAGAPEEKRKKLSLVFGVIGVLGLVLLVVYYVGNPGQLVFDQVA
jgi:hypothetical protein